MPGLDDEVLVVVVALVVEVSIGVGGSIGMETGEKGLARVSCQRMGSGQLLYAS